MKFYSTVTRKLYDTVEELEGDELAAKKTAEEKKKAEEEKRLEREKVEQEITDLVNSINEKAERLSQMLGDYEKSYGTPAISFWKVVDGLFGMLLK